MDFGAILIIVFCIVTLIYDYRVDKGVRKELVEENNNLRKFTKVLNDNKIELIKHTKELREQCDTLRELYEAEYKLRKMMEKNKEG